MRPTNFNISALLSFGFFIFALIACQGNSEQKVEKKESNEPQSKSSTSGQNLNISLLLDLSDRISPTKNPNSTMEFYYRDIGYIKSIGEAFDSHLRSKKIRQTNEKIQVFFDPAPENNEINSIAKSLRYSIDRHNSSRELLNKVKNTYASQPEKIYQLAIKDNNFVGSDIWKFFKNNVNDYCIENDKRNILIIFTDGYIFHENTKFNEDNLSSYLTASMINANHLNSSDWKQTMEDGGFGFIPISNDLSNLEILVLGINPNTSNPYEEDVIKEYWSKWLTAMNVKRFEIKSADLPSNMDKVIKEFIIGV